MKNIQKFIIEKVFWWTGIAHKENKAFVLKNFEIGLSFYFLILFLMFLMWLMLAPVVCYIPPEDQTLKEQIAVVVYLPIVSILFLKLVLFAFFYKSMIDYQNNRIQELIPEYDPKLNLDDKDLLRDAIKDALKIEGVKDDEFAEVVRALLLQNMEKQFRTKKAQRKKIDKIKSYTDLEIKDKMKMQFDDE